MPGELVAFDLETTGLSPRSDRIIEVGAVRFRSTGEVVDRLEVLVDPGIPLPVAIQRLTGIRDQDLVGAPTPTEAVAMLADFAEGAELVAHGAAFDLAHCAALLPGAFGGRSCQDTLELARILLPRALSHSLPLLSGSLGIVHDRPHRALSDADATRALLVHLVGVAEELPAEVLAVVRALLGQGRSPLRRFFLGLVEGEGRAERPAVRGAPVVLRRMVPVATAAPEPLDVASARALGPDGPLAAALPGFELRDSQVEMARAVGQTLERNGRLLVEAGTGTGKSIAYLTPLLLWAQRSGGRAVVATHTITLQEQLADRDLPALASALGVEVDSALLKGRQHYLSLRRWQRFLGTVGGREGRPAAEMDAVRFVLKVLCWLAETQTGDRAELRLSGTEEGYWRSVMSETGDCLGSACANWRDQRCYMVAARRRAAEASIVVTNHALLVADSERQGQVLTPYSVLVVDEAQHLEDTATRQLGTTLRAADILSVLDSTRLPVEESGELAMRIARCREAVQRLFGDVKGHVAGSLGLDNPGNATLGLADHVREHPAFETLLRAARHAAGAMRDTTAALLAQRGRLPQQGALWQLPQPDAIDDELTLAAATLEDAAAAVEAVLLAPRDGMVAWLELRAEQAELHEAPTSVGEALAEAVFDKADAAVLTSATLSIAGSFAYIQERTGLGRRVETLQLSAPFDYLQQALTVLATDIPPYDDPAYDSAIASLTTDLALRLGGRTLVLFTGYSALRNVHSLLGNWLESEHIAVLGQGLDGTRRQVLASFLQNPRTVLLGTSSFWEGIDIPGEALRCVVIAKLPFPVPTDPLVQARGALLNDPFTELLLPAAVLRLKQGFGRLIRRGGDRGAVVLCDQRILGRDYGQTFLRALPEATVVRSPSREVGSLVDEFVRSGHVPDQGRVEVRSAADFGEDEGYP